MSLSDGLHLSFLWIAISGLAWTVANVIASWRYERRRRGARSWFTVRVVIRRG